MASLTVNIASIFFNSYVIIHIVIRTIRTSSSNSFDLVLVLVLNLWLAHIWWFGVVLFTYCGQIKEEK